MIRFLQQQNSALKAILGVVIGVFIIVLVITLVPGVGEWANAGTTAGVLVKVGDRVVTATDAERQAAMVMRRNRIPDQMRAMVLPRILDQMVVQRSLLAAADQMGLQVTDPELQSEFRTNPQFSPVLFPGGQWVGHDRYVDIVQSATNMSVENFEEQVKQDLLMQKLQSIVAGAATVNDAELQKAFNEQGQKVKINYATFNLTDLTKGINPTDQELRAYYESHKAQYANSIPEKRKLKYAVIDASKAGNTNVTAQELQSYYDSHKQQFNVPERVKAAHILITPKPGKDGKPDDAAAKAKAEDLLKQVKGGADFAKLAKENSDDPGSKENGGELGFFGKGQMVPEFEKAAFALNQGQVSDLVHTSYGYHIIKVEQKEAAHPQSLDEVKPQIQATLESQKRSQAINKYVDQVQADVKSEGLDKAAAKFGLKIETTDFVSQTDPLPGVGPAPEVAQAAFSGSKNSPVIAKAGQTYAIVEATDIQPAATPTFEQAKEQVTAQFKQERAQDLLQRKTQELADRAKAEKDLKKAAQEVGATYKTSDFVGANGTVPDIGSMSGAAQVAFTLDAGQVSGPETSGSTGFVLQVAEKQQPSAEDFAKQKDTLRAQMLTGKRNQIFGEFAQATRARFEKEGKIHWNKDEQKRLGLGQPAPGLNP